MGWDGMGYIRNGGEINGIEKDLITNFSEDGTSKEVTLRNLKLRIL